MPRRPPAPETHCAQRVAAPFQEVDRRVGGEPEDQGDEARDRETGGGLEDREGPEAVEARGEGPAAVERSKRRRAPVGREGLRLRTARVDQPPAARGGLRRLE